VLYRETVERLAPEDTDIDNGIVAYGWTQAAMLIEVLEAAEAPTRLAVMESARNMDGISAGLLLDDISITTGGEDAYMGETVTLIEYNLAEKRFELIGELLDLEGQTRDFASEEVINS